MSKTLMPFYKIWQANKIQKKKIVRNVSEIGISQCLVNITIMV